MKISKEKYTKWKTKRGMNFSKWIIVSFGNVFFVCLFIFGRTLVLVYFNFYYHDLPLVMAFWSCRLPAIGSDKLVNVSWIRTTWKSETKILRIVFSSIWFNYKLVFFGAENYAAKNSDLICVLQKFFVLIPLITLTLERIGWLGALDDILGEP